MTAMMADPSTFCVGDLFANESALLWRMQAGGGGYMRNGQSVTCASSRCLQDTVLAVADFASIEALVDTHASSGVSVPLYRYYSADVGDQVLASRPPGPSYKLWNQSAAPEGWCAAKPDTVASQPLTLWFSASLHDHRTCGGGCNHTAMATAGYLEVSTICYGHPATDPATLPCMFGLPSIARSDTAFWDQLYWRGRIWAPQAFLAYAGLKNAGGASADATRKQLAAQARRLFTQQLSLFGQINENTNGVLGVGSDSVRADSYYHWGALHALVAIAETGVYPSDML